MKLMVTNIYIHTLGNIYCAHVVIFLGLKHLFNFTVASCECFTCCCKKHYDDVGDTDSIEDEDIRNIKEKLRFHFMNPFEKWKYPRKRRFPWKLLIQLISIFLVTVQVSEIWRWWCDLMRLSVLCWRCISTITVNAME